MASVACVSCRRDWDFWLLRTLGVGVADVDEEEEAIVVVVFVVMEDKVGNTEGCGIGEEFEGGPCSDGKDG